MAAGKAACGLSDSEPMKVTGAQFPRWPRGFVWRATSASKRRMRVVVVSGRGEVDVVRREERSSLRRVESCWRRTARGKHHTTRIGARRRSCDALAAARPETLMSAYNRANTSYESDSATAMIGESSTSAATASVLGAFLISMPTVAGQTRLRLRAPAAASASRL